MRWNDLGSVLIVVMRPVLQPSRTHLIHRPAKDAPFPPAGGILWGDPLSRWLCDHVSSPRSTAGDHLLVPTFFALAARAQVGRQGPRAHRAATCP